MTSRCQWTPSTELAVEAEVQAAAESQTAWQPSDRRHTTQSGKVQPARVLSACVAEDTNNGSVSRQ